MVNLQFEKIFHVCLIVPIFELEFNKKRFIINKISYSD